MEENKVILTVDVNGTKAEQGLKAVDKELKSTGNTAKTTKKDLKDVDNALDALPGSAGNAAQGVKGLLTQFKALIANPIGLTIAAIAGALALVYKGLSTLSPVVDAFENTMGGLSATMDALFSNIGKFLSGSKEATMSLQDAYKYGVQAAKATREYEDAMNSLVLINARYDSQIDLLIRKAKNQALSDKQRNDLLREALRLQDEQIKKNREALRYEGEAIAFKVKAAKGSYAQLQAIAKGATVKDLNIQDETLEKLLKEYELYVAKRIQSEGNFNLTKERVKNSFDANELKDKGKINRDAEIKDLQEKVKAEDERINKIEKNRMEREASLRTSDREQYAAHLSDLESIRNDDLLSQEERFAAIDELNKKGVLSDREAADAKLKITKAEIDGKMDMLDSYASILNSTADLVGKDTAEGKALAVAAATISTYAAIAKNLSAFAGVPIPGYAIAQSIATGVAGLAAVRNILKVNVPGKGGSSGSSGSPSLPPIVKPTSSFTTINNEEPIPTIGKGEGAKVYVTETDISNVQNKVNGIKAKATL